MPVAIIQLNPSMATLSVQRAKCQPNAARACHLMPEVRKEQLDKKLQLFAGTFDPRNVQWTFSVDTREPS